jgi:hypothetical protein
VAAPRIVPAFNELEDGHTGLRLGAELAPVEQLALERGEEALAQYPRISRSAAEFTREPIGEPPLAVD